MIPDKKLIEQYGKTVYTALWGEKECTLQELQSLCKIKNTDLCFTLLHLLKEKKVESVFNDGRVTYRIHFH